MLVENVTFILMGYLIHFNCQSLKVLMNLAFTFFVLREDYFTKKMKKESKIKWKLNYELNSKYVELITF